MAKKQHEETTDVVEETTQETQAVATANPDERYHHEAYVAKMKRQHDALTGMNSL